MLLTVNQLQKLCSLIELADTEMQAQNLLKQFYQ
jgi:hypothetical protein